MGGSLWPLPPPSIPPPPRSHSPPIPVPQLLQFFIAEDRLYYTADPEQERTTAKTRYIPLDRMPVRPLPHRWVAPVEEQSQCTADFMGGVGAWESLQRSGWRGLALPGVGVLIQEVRGK